MKQLLKIWTTNIELLSDEKKGLFNNRISRVQRHFEFQRTPEILDFLANYKGTQFRIFLLYVGVFVLKDLLPPDYYQNFCYLVAATRLMAKKVPYDENDENRKPYLKFVANRARTLIKEFITSGSRLYGREFVQYNVHNLWHLPDDYEEYGALDDFSNFPYESVLYQVKRYIRSGYKPLKQVVNNFSDRLATNLFVTDCCDLQDCLSEYLEEPELRQELSQLDEDYKIADVEHWRFKEMRFQTFLLRMYGPDHYCAIKLDGKTLYMQIMRISQHTSTEEIHLVGKCFTHLKPVFVTKFGSSNDLGMTYVLMCKSL